MYREATQPDTLFLQGASTLQLFADNTVSLTKSTKLSKSLLKTEQVCKAAYQQNEEVLGIT